MRLKGQDGWIDLDERYRPIVISTLVDNYGDALYAEHLAALLRILVTANQPFVYVIDATRAGWTSPRQRRMQADWLRENRPRLHPLVLGGAFAFSNPIARGALVAIHWLAPPAHPVAVVRTRGEALAWATKLLEQRGLDVPSKLADAYADPKGESGDRGSS